MTFTGYLQTCVVSGSFVLATVVDAQSLSAGPGGGSREARSAPTAASTSAEERSVPDGLDAGDWDAILAAYEAGRHAAYPIDEGYRATNPGQEWQTIFDGRGFTTKPDEDAWTWGLELRSYGFRDRQRSVSQPTQVTAEGGRVAYAWDDTLTEWYENDTRGLEHGYTVHRRPAGREVEGRAGPLAFTLAVRGALSPEVTADGRGARFVDAKGAVVLTYSGLTVFDADGRTLPARLEPADAGLLLTVDERDARYPLTIDPLVQVAYLKASNTGSNDGFGVSVAISGNTVVVGANGERSAATGVNGDQSDNSAPSAGAVYVFVRSAGVWSQQAYLKASNTDNDDNFGASVSVDGDTLVVGSWGEASSATGVDGNSADNTSFQSGAAYVFVRTGTNWSQQAYLKASNTGSGDLFGTSIGLSGDTVVVGAVGESSDATGVDGDGTDNSQFGAGAAYVFVRSGTSWSQQAYLKASNTDANDGFGVSVSVSGDTVVCGANAERSGATGIDGDQNDDMVSLAGAAYVFVRSGSSWSQEAYVKASNTDSGDLFGQSVSVSGDTLIVGASREGSSATGVGGDQDDDSAAGAGAAYVFVRSGSSWSQEAYLKASNTEAGDGFGGSVAVSGDMAVVGAIGESSNATGVDGDGTDNSALGAGAAYAFVRDGTTWSHEAYLKASNAESNDFFGSWVAVSGTIVVVGARLEGSSATGVNGNDDDNGAVRSGAAYVFNMRSGNLKIRRFNGTLGTAEPRFIEDFTEQANLGTDGAVRGSGHFQVVPGDPPSLRVSYDRGGALVVLRVGMHRFQVGERWLVSPVLWRRAWVLGKSSPEGASLQVDLERMPRAPGDRPLFAQLLVLDPEGGVASSDVIQLEPGTSGR